MTDITAPPPPKPILTAMKRQRVWLASATILAIIAALSPSQATDSATFIASALLSTGPFLALSVLVAAGAGATGADSLIARAFTGSTAVMVFLAALAGGLSPFCSCGVIPLIAALLTMGVPLSAVMAFWLASPIMDPSMFLLTSGVLGAEFAVAKTLAAIGLGLLGGYTVALLMAGGFLTSPLRDGIGNGGCASASVRAPKPVVWHFWSEPARLHRFKREALKTTLFLLQWLVLAFLLESLMLAFIPAEAITQILGGQGPGPIALATLVGVPAYLNGYAALPLVGGLMTQGMAPGAAMSFLVAGGVTSLPAAIAVWALVRPPVFLLYIAISLAGALAAGLAFQVWTMG
ncbi:permease [Jannaschia pohangensis]|uniref:Permease n=1 Tax=Jannaschia pohangensis TaxID=390807 RepID=A0A1I3SR23_9RHOB|nr:permease [Jannaschia pohangensis]SFJ60632.1 hypothetical protein SAMN04488095_3231 [Jannaschia pohangensis]